jgi:GTPase SAR1 family protein
MGVRRWTSDVRSIARPDAVVILIGNKVDLAESRSITRTAAEELAAELGCRYFETSARTGHNIEDAVLSCVADVEELIRQGKYDGRVDDAFVIPGEETSTAHRKCC